MNRTQEFLDQARQLIDQKQPAEALLVLKKIIRKHPAHYAAHVLRGEALIASQSIAKAYEELIKAAQIDRRQADAWDLLLPLMVKDEKFSDMLAIEQQFDEALKTALSLDGLIALGYAFERTGDFDEAIAYYQRALQHSPEHPRATLSYANALRYAGRKEEAVTQYQAVMLGDSDYVPVAAWSLANLKQFKFAPADIERVEKYVAEKPDNYYAHFALGQAYETQKEYQISFEHYQKANQLRSASINFSPEKFSAYCDELINNFPMLQVQGKTSEPKLIFIVGMPRSGSTLTEQILSSHSQVVRMGELPYINRILWDLQNRKQTIYPRCVSSLNDADISRYRQYYLDACKNHYEGKPAFIIDKNPNNFENVGMIKRLFPDALIIDTRREYAANAFALYKQLFIRGQDYSYSFKHIHAYYSGYLKLIEHWQQCFNDTLITINYESLVQDFETTVRSLLKFCGLEEEQGCFEFYKNKQAVDTASSEQVRQPIYKDGLAYWRNFETFLPDSAVKI